MKKEELINRLFAKPITRNFTVRQLDQLMNKCGCEKFPGGRGSGLKYYHKVSQRVLAFDGPHPGNELYPYQVKKVQEFLINIGER